jgi:hypothetical protein
MSISGKSLKPFCPYTHLIDCLGSNLGLNLKNSATYCLKCFCAWHVQWLGRKRLHDRQKSMINVYSISFLPAHCFCRLVHIPWTPYWSVSRKQTLGSTRIEPWAESLSNTEAKRNSGRKFGTEFIVSQNLATHFLLFGIRFRSRDALFLPFLFPLFYLHPFFSPHIFMLASFYFSVLHFLFLPLLLLFFLPFVNFFHG